MDISELLFFLHSWFIDHVEGLDQQYGPWLNKQGVYQSGSTIHVPFLAPCNVGIS